jgi:D-inositol-3-phosphate glycosyltransferase
VEIAMISEHASPLAALGGVDSGGQNVYVAQVASELGRRGHRVTVFTRRDAVRLPNELVCAPNVRLVHVTAGPPEPVPKERLLPYMPEFTQRVIDWLDTRGRSFDLVHAHFFMSAQVAAELQRLRDLPFVVTLHALGRVRRRHQGTADRFPDERFAIEERVVAQARVIVAECPQDRDDLLGLYGAPAERIRVVPCGFSPSELGPAPKREARNRLGLEPNEAVVLQLGRMVPRKGVDTAIQGLARLIHGYGIPARLLVVGGDTPVPDPVATPELGRLMALAEREGVAPQVRFEGRRDRAALRDYYAASDVFVSTPWYEPFGITPVEAMACGLPVLGAAVGGIKTTVVDGETGFLVPPSDPTAVAERLAVMLKDPALLRRMSARALVRSVEFTWERVTDRLLEVYREATGARPRSLPRQGEASATIDRPAGSGRAVRRVEANRRTPGIPAALDGLDAVDKATAGDSDGRS